MGAGAPSSPCSKASSAARCRSRSSARHDPPAGLVGDLVEHLDHAAGHVHHHVATAVAPAQVRLQPTFQTGLAHDVPGAIPVEAWLLQLGGPDLSNGPEQVGCQCAFQVVAPRLHVGDHPGQRVAVRLDAGQGVEVEVVDDRDRPMPPASGAVDAGLEHRRLLLDQGAQHLPGSSRRIECTGNHLELPGRPGGGEHPPLPIQDLAARRLQPERADRVLLGAPAQLFAFEDLEVEQAQPEHGEHQHDGAAHQLEPPVQARFGTPQGARHQSPERRVSRRSSRRD